MTSRRPLPEAPFPEDPFAEDPSTSSARSTAASSPRARNQVHDVTSSAVLRLALLTSLHLAWSSSSRRPQKVLTPPSLRGEDLAVGYEHPRPALPSLKQRRTPIRGKGGMLADRERPWCDLPNKI